MREGKRKKGEKEGGERKGKRIRFCFHLVQDTGVKIDRAHEIIGTSPVPVIDDERDLQ